MRFALVAGIFRVALSVAFAFSLCVAAVVRSSPERAIAAAQTGPCGPVVVSHLVVDPPDVEMSKAPLDASDDHELIMAVHHDGERYCYRYTWQGATYTASPTIRVRRGERFAIRIVNDIASQSAGERAASTAIPPCKPMAMPPAPIEHWVGYLNHVIDDRYMRITDLDTNLHLHGFEGPELEENIFLSTLSTPIHACEYRVTIPRTQPPGTYLYHPHAHGSADDTVAGGLDGTWIVEPDDARIPRADEHVLVLRYRIPIEFDNAFVPNDGGAGLAAAAAHVAALAPAAPVRYDPFNPPPWPVTFPMDAGGVRGDPRGCTGLGSEPRIAVNNADAPATMTIAAGRPQLLRFVNGTSDTAKLLEVHDASGHLQTLHVVETDGVPVSGDTERPLSKYLAMLRVMLSPMARAGIMFTAAPGQTYTVSSEPYCDGSDGFFEMHHDILTISSVASTESGPAVAQPQAIAPDDTPAARLVAFVRAHPRLVRRRAITFTEYFFPKRYRVPAHYGFYITDTTNPNFHEHPFWPEYARGAVVPERADIVVKQGTIEEWYLFNATLETHDFHIHQMAFVEERSYEGSPLTVDTAFLHVGRTLRNPRDPNYPLVVPSVTKLILDFRHVPKGSFVFHCHMLFHEDRGMMGVVRVI